MPIGQEMGQYQKIPLKGPGTDPEPFDPALSATGLRASGHRQLTKIGLSDGCGGNLFQRRCKLGTIAMNLNVIWEMLVFIYDLSQR